MDDNLARQADEVEALSSIYGDEWRVLDEAGCVFCIDVEGGKDEALLKVSLQVTLPSDYPSHSPPQYQINAPWLRGDDRMKLTNSLEDLFCENIGENIIYLWVEKIREFLTEKSNNQDSDPSLLVDETRDEDDCEGIQVSNEIGSSKDCNQTVDVPPIYDGEARTDRKSKFQAHLAPVTNKEQIQLVLDKLLENKKIAAATHNIFAYRIFLESNNVLQGCEDDGETHAGNRMLHLMQIVDARNVIVIVTRWYGGVHLGPDRFKHINNLTREILQEHGYISHRAEKKGPTSSKKGK